MHLFLCWCWGSTLEGVSLPWQGWDSLSQSGLPCHSCYTNNNPPYAGRRSSGEGLHIYSTVLGPVGRETPRPLGLMVGSIIWSPSLLMPRFGPRWSTNPLWLLWLLWALTLHLTLHLLHNPGLLHQSSEILDGQESTITRISP